MTDAPLQAQPWDDELDSFDAAIVLGITVNHLRQLAFKGHIKPTRYHKRRAIFKRMEVERLRDDRIKELKDLREAIAVSQQNLPQE